MSYLISSRTGELLADTSIHLKSGASVDVAHDTVKEALDANREHNLVNSFTVKVSNDQKWAKIQAPYFARSINNSEDEFLLISHLD